LLSFSFFKNVIYFAGKISKSLFKKRASITIRSATFFARIFWILCCLWFLRAKPLPVQQIRNPQKCPSSLAYKKKPLQGRSLLGLLRSGGGIGRGILLIKQ
jgi:hypothetical protein